MEQQKVVMKKQKCGRGNRGSGEADGRHAAMKKPKETHKAGGGVAAGLVRVHSPSRRPSLLISLDPLLLMESHLGDRFVPNDKTQVALRPTDAEGAKAFLARLTPEELEALRQLKEEFPDLCLGFTDSFLMKFIWARKLDINRAAEVIREHIQWRKEWDLEHVNVDAVEAYLDSGVCYWVPGLYSRQGYSASFMVPRNLDLSMWRKIGSQGMLHAAYYVTDLAGDHDIDIARQGTMLVIDFAGASWSDLMSAVKGEGDFDLSKLIDSGQNHMPSRVRDVILLNPPWWIRVLLNIVKPLLKSNLRKKIHSCRSSELSQYFTPDNILSEWGGQRKFDQKAWAHSVLQLRPDLSEGKYIDPSPRSEEAIRRYTGAQAIGTANGVASIAKAFSTPGKAEA